MALKHSKLYAAYKRSRALKSWKKRGYAAPSPAHMKEFVLKRNGIENATWVETGTYHGDTTAFLAKTAQNVITIEPSPKYYQEAIRRFKNSKNVEVIHGVSESVFPLLLPKLSGDVSFWLDGHYSAGNTFRGGTDTPIVTELTSLEENLMNFRKVSVLVDDVRCFFDDSPEFRDYPSLDFLVDWSRRNHMRWQIEHDIFIASNFSSQSILY